MISNDGEWIAWENSSGIILRNGIHGTNQVVSSVRDDVSAAVTQPLISPDGRYTVYESTFNLYCYDRITRQCYMMTTNGSGTTGGTDISFGAQFTADGRACLFTTYATNLCVQPTNAFSSQVLRRDMQTGEIGLVSTAATNLRASAMNPILIQKKML